MKSLIKKRQTAIKNSTYNQPLSNPQWPSMEGGSEAIELEGKYLTELCELFTRLGDQATTLCIASSEIQRELCSHEVPKILVTLPVDRANNNTRAVAQALDAHKF